MHFKTEARKYTDPEKMAADYLKSVFREQKIQYPINPFALMKKEGILFKFMDSHNLEGVYIPANSENDIPVVGINFNRNITRQRFTAAHELCHHFKDADRPISCPINGSKNDKIEKFADRFASSLLMPFSELKTQIEVYKKNREDDILYFDDILHISHFFGVNFQACCNRLAYDLNYPIESTSKNSRKKFAPDKRRKELKLSHVELYADLLNCFEEQLSFKPGQLPALTFQNKYLFNDSRMEGINVSSQEVSEIVADLRFNTQNSIYCKEDNEGYMSIAGHFAMYQEIFKATNSEVSIYDAFILNRKLFSCYPNPKTGGLARKSNTWVIGSKFETADYKDITPRINELNNEINILNKRINKISFSEFVKHIIRIHHKFTVIHPFNDGNGRTARAFMNLQFVRAGFLPVYIKVEDKNAYLEALSLADKNNDYSELYELIFKIIIRAHVELSSENL